MAVLGFKLPVFFKLLYGYYHLLIMSIQAKEIKRPNWQRTEIQGGI